MFFFCVWLVMRLSSASGSTDADDLVTSTMSTMNADGPSCTELKEPSMAQDVVAKLSADYLNTCLATLGKDPLSSTDAAAIWARVLEVNANGSPENVPDALLRRLGWVVIGIPASHLANLSLTDVDTIAALGTFRNLSEAQLTALAQAFSEQWAAKEPEDWTDIDLAMLGHIVCGFNATDLLRVHADAYKMAALDGKLANLRGCSNDTLRSLATLASGPDAFGDPQFWEAPQVRGVGCVLSGLSSEALERIPRSAMVGLSAESVHCLPPKTMSVLTPEQLAGLSPAAAAAVTASQREFLDSAQVMALSALVEEHAAKNGSPCGSDTLSLLATLFISMHLLSTHWNN